MDTSTFRPDRISEDLNSGYSFQVLIEIIENFNKKIINELTNLKNQNEKIDIEFTNLKKEILKLERQLYDEKVKLKEEIEKNIELTSNKDVLINKFKQLVMKTEELDRKYTKLQTDYVELTIKYKVKESELTNEKLALTVAITEFNKYKDMVLELEEENLDLKRQIITLTKPAIILESFPIEFMKWKKLKMSIMSSLKTPIKLGSNTYYINQDFTISKLNNDLPFGKCKYNYEDEVLEVHQYNL